MGTEEVVEAAVDAPVETDGTTVLVSEHRANGDTEWGRPPARPAEVERTDLLGLHGSHRSRKVVLLSAPAGYGKSILAAQWCGVDPSRPAIWIDLVDTDNDPAAFLAHVYAGVDEVREDRAETAGTAASAPSVVTLPALAAAMAQRAPFLLVFDDVHHVTDPTSLGLLGEVIDALPRTCQVLIAGRVDPAIGLGRRRANGDVLDIRADQLAMDLATTVRYLRAAGADIGVDAATDLQDKTEGWPAGIGLAILSRQGGRPSSDLVAELSGEQRQITDYLVEEVLAHQDEATRQFLLQTSVLSRFCGPLCDAVLDGPDAGRIIRSVERNNLFVVPLDNHRAWYRYHHLFQEMLAAELDRTDPGARQRLLRRAAAWSEEHGTVAEALRYAQDSGDMARAGGLVLAHWQEYASRNQIETLRMWVTRSTDAQIMSDPSMAIGSGWVFTMLGDVARAERYAAAAANHPLDAPSPDGATSLRSALANFRSGLGTSGVDQMLEDALLVEAAERPARTRWLLGGSRGVGTALLMLGRVDEAVIALEEAALLSESPEAMTSVRVFCLGYLALALLDGGKVERAATIASEAELLIADEGVAHTFQCLPYEVASAAIRVRRGDRPGAVGEVTATAERLDVTAAAPWMLADLSLRCAETAFEVGEIDAAVALLDRARRALTRLPDAGTMPDRLAELEQRTLHLEPAVDSLTPAERRVGKLLTTHHTLSDIGELLFISRSTVKTHVSSIYSKLNVSTRAEAVAKLTTDPRLSDGPTT